MLDEQLEGGGDGVRLPGNLSSTVLVLLGGRVDALCDQLEPGPGLTAGGL